MLSSHKELPGISCFVKVGFCTMQINYIEKLKF